MGCCTSREDKANNLKKVLEEPNWKSFEEKATKHFDEKKAKDTNKVSAEDARKIVNALAADNNLPEITDEQFKAQAKDAKDFDQAGFNALVKGVLTAVNEAEQKRVEEEKKAAELKKQAPAENKTPENTTAPAETKTATPAAK